MHSGIDGAFLASRCIIKEPARFIKRSFQQDVWDAASISFQQLYKASWGCHYVSKSHLAKIWHPPSPTSAKQAEMFVHIIANLRAAYLSIIIRRTSS